MNQILTAKEWNPESIVKIGEVVKYDNSYYINKSGKNGPINADFSNSDWQYFSEADRYSNFAKTDSSNLTPEYINNWKQKLGLTAVGLSIKTIADLRNFDANEGDSVILLGYYSAGDKDPLLYKYTLSGFSTNVDDGGYKIKTTKGTWIAQFNGRINALDFGVIPDYNTTTGTGTDNSDKVLKMYSVPAAIYEWPAGWVLLNSHIKIPNGVLNIGKGTAKTGIRRGTSTGSSTGVLYQLSSSNEEIVDGSTWQDMSFDGGANGSNHNQWTHLASIAGTRNAKFIRCNFYKFRGDGILVSSGPGSTDRRKNINVLIEDCFFDGVVFDNRNGISVIQADGVTIKRCWLQNIGNNILSRSVGGIDVERNDPTDQITSNIVIDGCTFLNLTSTNTAGIALFCHGSNTKNLSPASKDHIIKNNRFINCYWGISIPELKLDKSNNVTPTAVNIHDNFFIDSVKAIQLNDNSGISIFDNYFFGDYAAAKYCNIEMWNEYTAKNIKILNNHFFNTGRNGSIEIKSVDGLVIKGNTCSSNRPFISQDLDSLSNTTKRVLNNIDIRDNSFEGLGDTLLNFYQVASGLNNEKLIMNNSSCTFENNKVSGNARLTNMTTSVFNRMVLDSHITPAMVTGTWRTGDFVESRLAERSYRIRCTTSGTTAFTGDPINVSATNGSRNLTKTSALDTFIRKGMFILVGDDVVNEVIDVYDDTIVLKNNYAGTTLPDALVTASPAQFISEAITPTITITTSNTNFNLCRGEDLIVFNGGGVATSLITSDSNGFRGARKRYKNNKTDILTISASTGVTINGLNPGSLFVNPGKSVTLFATAPNTWISMDYIPSASSTVTGTVKKSAAVLDVTNPDATDLPSAIALLNEVKRQFNLTLGNDRSAEQQS